MKAKFWDNLAQSVFDSNSKMEGHASAMDNILIAYPQIHRIIAEKFPDSQHISILDYGCGTGTFLKELPINVRQAVGIDYSKKMIAIATQKNNTEHIQFINGDEMDIPKNSKYDIITSIMVLVRGSI